MPLASKSATLLVAYFLNRLSLPVSPRPCSAQKLRGVRLPWRVRQVWAKGGA